MRSSGRGRMRISPTLSVRHEKVAGACKISVLCMVAIVCGIGMAGTQPVLGQSKTEDYEVKAEDLYNFAEFTEWPPNTFPDKKSPIAVCVFGKDPFSGDLETTVLGKNKQGRSFETRHTNRVNGLRGCQMVFVDRTEAKHLPEILEAVKSAPVLLVGDRADFVEKGGEIAFVTEDGKVHFIVNVDAVERAHLKISSKLLLLAKIVHDEATRKEN
ncbi:MAG TPA: YfiR family protein [Candidatus Acidoferrales bacterium]|nr:YfiR family protein [Candidatus Acidoferrales bacterium]